MIAVFGLLKRGEKVYTAMIPNAKTETLLPIIKEKVQPVSVVYTDSFKVYNRLDVSDFHHRRINHSTLFAKRETTSMELKTSGTRRSII
jgi:transposase